MSTALTTSSFTTAADVMLAPAALRLRTLAKISLPGAAFALAEECMS